MTDVLEQRAQDIGFNESIQVDGRELHVQTEVLGRRQLLVQTTVNEGGMVRLVEKQVYQGDPARLEDLRAVVRDQHVRHVRKLTEAEPRGAH